MQVTIEPSGSGKTFGIALSKKEGDKPFMVVKGCRLANKKDGGQFVSGPSAKMDDGSYLNYLFIDKEFADYVLDLVLKTMQAPAKSISNKDDDSLPF